MNTNTQHSQFQNRFDNLLTHLTNDQPFGNFRILHGYWDKLAKIKLNGIWPLTKENRDSADLLISTEGLFSSGLSEEINKFLSLNNDPLGFKLSISTIAQPKSALMTLPNTESLRVLKDITDRPVDSIGATLPKYLVETGQFSELIKTMENWEVLVVGPAFLTTSNIRLGKKTTLLEIPEWEASLIYERIISSIEGILRSNPKIKCVVLSAGNIPSVIGWNLFSRFPSVKWLDLGIALSVFNPEGIASLPWFANNYVSVMKTFDEVAFSQGKETIRSWQRLHFESNLFNEIRAFIQTYNGGRKTDVLKYYTLAKDNLVHLPKVRTELLNLTIRFSDLDSSINLEELLEWELGNLSNNSFSSKLLLAQMLQLFPTFHESFLLLCDELTRDAPNDYRSRLLKTQFFLKAGEMKLARETFSQELECGFSQFRQIKRIERQLL